MKSFHHEQFGGLNALVEEKSRAERTISLCIPTLNEEGTIARIIETIHQTLVTDFPLLDEIVVIDSGSSDRTRSLAAEAGAEVVLAADILPFHGNRVGKGENLWKAVHHCRGDIICFVDGDITNIHPRFVYGTVGPLLTNPELCYVKGFYERPLLAQQGIDPRGGGRVTEILVRPLFQRFCPDLSQLHQPLAGEYAATRDILESIPFPTAYGVETSHLIDVWRMRGIDAIGQTDLDERRHRNRSLADLGRMSDQILEAFFSRLPDQRHSKSERPPMIEIPDYLERFPRKQIEARRKA